MNEGNRQRTEIIPLSNPQTNPAPSAPTMARLERPFPLHQGHTQQRAAQPQDRSYRKINLGDDQDEGHPGGDDNRGRDLIGDRLEGGEAKEVPRQQTEHHNQSDQRQCHPQVLAHQPASAPTRLPGGSLFLDCCRCAVHESFRFK